LRSLIFPDSNISLFSLLQFFQANSDAEIKRLPLPCSFHALVLTKCNFVRFYICIDVGSFQQVFIPLDTNEDYPVFNGHISNMSLNGCTNSGKIFDEFFPRCLQGHQNLVYSMEFLL